MLVIKLRINFYKYQMINFLKYFVTLFVLFLNNFVYADIVKSITILGNDRISSETIKTFSNISIDDEIDDIKINTILIDLYSTNFFENVSVKYLNETLEIIVEENPIINNLTIDGIKSKTILDELYKILTLKNRSSYNIAIANSNMQLIINYLKRLGYYFSNVQINLVELDDNKIDLIYKVELGDKAKVKKITFLGDKVFKDRKLKNIIITEEYKFWKFISGKKYLNQDLINLDARLLKNFYLNKGFYNVVVNTSFAKLINDDEFEVIYNIDANSKVYFGDISLFLPINFNKENFSKLDKVFIELKNQPYSIDSITKIINEIENLSLNEQYESITVNVDENLVDNKLLLNFSILETEKFMVNKINVFGNNVTNENVIRNQLELDEGDPFNEILFTKSINNLKKLNFFKNVDGEIVTDDKNYTKNLDIYVEEKPTGEIALGAGFGTGGGTLAFSVKENNFLGNGVSLNTSLSLSEQTIKGEFTVSNPNYKNTDKSLYYSIQALEIDRLAAFGYKSNKTGFSVGTNFEYLDDLNLGLGIDNFYEKITTDTNASARQKTQSGNYWDTFLNLDINFDKRNQKFQTTSGYFSNYGVKIPLISESMTLVNDYNYKFFTELYEDNITTASFSFSIANALNNKDIKLSERLFLSSRKLRGFESGKIGPKDGSDFIGGNYLSAINLSTTLPQFLENYQNLDLLLFMDAANVWGVDYDNSLDDASGIRSSIGLGVDWLTPVGPMSFSLAQPLTKEKGDITESFRFNLGTTF